MSVTIEIKGTDSAVVDDATSTLLEELSGAGVDVSSAQTSGERDGGIVALSIAILGGAASVAQVAATIHALSRKKEVQFIVIDASGSANVVSADDKLEKVQALIQQAET